MGSIPSAKRNKYGAVRCELDGYKFDSRAEMRRYSELALLQRARKIENLTPHPKYPLLVNGILVAHYIPDFEYRDRATGKVRVEDVKGGKATNTPVSKLKQKMFAAQYGVNVEVVA